MHKYLNLLDQPSASQALTLNQASSGMINAQSQLSGYNQSIQNNLNTSGGWGQSQNCILNYPGYYQYPYYQYPYSSVHYVYMSSPSKVDVTIRKVENGWIVTKDGKEFVCSDKKDIAELID